MKGIVIFHRFQRPRKFWNIFHVGFDNPVLTHMSYFSLK